MPEGECGMHQLGHGTRDPPRVRPIRQADKIYHVMLIYIPTNSYVSGLETRIKWLESLLREKVPGISLDNPPDNSPDLAQQDNHDGSAAAPSSDQGGSETQGSLRNISEQIGLVSIAPGTDMRYVGPSSGLFFTKYVMAGLAKQIRMENQTADATDQRADVPADLLVVQPKDLPVDQRQARWLSQAYFDIVHPQYPFLHEPTYLETIQKIYDGVEVGPIQEFQAFLVLAIGATIHSRRAKLALGAEGYYASAMSRMDSVAQSTSLGTTQCILLLEMYTLNNPTSGLNLWPLHYQSMAITIELGLHRTFPRKVHSVYEEQLRTRAFWCVYTMDRLLTTLMGRPLGLVEEQCDLRVGGTQHSRLNTSSIVTFVFSKGSFLTFVIIGCLTLSNLVSA